VQERRGNKKLKGDPRESQLEGTCRVGLRSLHGRLVGRVLAKKVSCCAIVMEMNFNSSQLF